MDVRATVVLGPTKGVLVPYKVPTTIKHFSACQQKVIAAYGKIVDGGPHGIITGVAGTGKTEVARHLATNPACGTQIHTALTLNQAMGGNSVGMLRPSKELWLDGIAATQVDRLILENAWMIDADVVTELDRWFRQARGNLMCPFGGIPQILLVGDWMSAEHLVDNHVKKSPAIRGLVLNTIKLEKILRWDPVDQDDFTDTLSMLHSAGNGVVPGVIPGHIEGFIDHYLNGFIPNTKVGHIALSLGKGDLKSQWEAFDKRKYKKEEDAAGGGPKRDLTLYFGPRGMLSSADPRKIEHAFPVVRGMPIRFVTNVVDPNNTSIVVVPEGEVAILKAVSKDEDDDYHSSGIVHPGIKGLVLTIKRITIPGNPILKLPPTPHLVPAIMEQAAKRARNDPDGGSGAGSRKRSHTKFVCASKWGFVPAWSMRISNAQNLTLHTHLSVNVYPLRFTDPKSMMLCYTALSRARMCTQVRFRTTVAKMRQTEEPEDPAADGNVADAEPDEEEEEEEEEDIYS